MVHKDFAKKVSEGLEDIDCSDVRSAVSMWDQLCSYLATSAIKVVGSDGCLQSDWFLESEQVFFPLLAAKKHTCDQLVSADSLSTHHRFRQCERAKRAVAS